MAVPFRVIDTGLREGRANIAFDAALIDLHAAGQIPDTIRFLRFRPTALVGRHQAITRELNLAQCRADDIGLARRITGGGAIYFDEGMLGWELVFSRRRLVLPSLADYTRKICESAADGLSRAFGIDARFRPRNDIEVGGRKLSGTGGFFEGDTLFFQGTVLIDADPARVMSYLNVPRAKTERHALDRAENRITTLKALTGASPEPDLVQQAISDGFARGLGLALASEPATPAEEERAARVYDDQVGQDDFVFEIDAPGEPGHLEASITGAGGTVTAFVRVDGRPGAPRIAHALITGDFFVTPPRLVLDLEAALRGVPVHEVGMAVDAFFTVARPDLLSIRPEDFRTAITTALTGIGQNRPGMPKN